MRRPCREKDDTGERSSCRRVWRELREGRTTAGERQEKTRAEERRGGRSAAASKAGMRKRGRVARPLLRGRIEIVRERGKAAGARRRNAGADKKRPFQSVGHIHGGGAARAGEGGVFGVCGTMLRKLGEFLSFQTMECLWQGDGGAKKHFGGSGSRQVHFCLRRRAEPRNCIAG